MLRTPGNALMIRVGLAGRGSHLAAAALCLSVLAGCPAAPSTSGPDAATDARPPDLVPPVTGPAKLSETGLYADFATRKLATDVIEYTPRYATWTDGTTSRWFFRLPSGGKIDTSDMDHWVFPVGTKAWKDFSKGGVLVETRYLHKVYDNRDGWWEMGYLWDKAGTEATATPDGAVNVLGTGYDPPSQMDCFSCHGNARDVLIGVSAIQLSAADGKGTLSKLAAQGLLTAPPAAEFQVPGAGKVQDALGYLHTNCADCHADGPVWGKTLALKLEVLAADRTPEATLAYRTSINVTAVHKGEGVDLIVKPGDPDGSQLYMRMDIRDERAMPPLGTHLLDDAGLALIRDWITGLPH